jgi:hypothetical protein
MVIWVVEAGWGDVVEVDECKGAIRESSGILTAGVENSRGLEGLRFWEGRRPGSDRRTKEQVAPSLDGLERLMCEGHPLQREGMDMLVGKDEGNVHINICKTVCEADRGPRSGSCFFHKPHQ